MTNWIAIAMSFLALVISAGTAWLTLLRRGRLRMTQPTVIFFGPDGIGRRGAKPRSKVFLRTLLYSTARRGQMLESLHVNLQRGETKQNFSIWVYGEPDRLARGSGLYVPAEGVACNHHFLLPEDAATFTFRPGEYVLRVFAKTVDAAVVELAVTQLRITESLAKELESEGAGIYFDWGPDQQAYHPHVEARPPKLLPSALFELASAQALEPPRPAPGPLDADVKSAR